MTDALAQSFPTQPPDRVKSLAQQVAEKARRELGDDINVIWFGSWVRGDAQPHSDIDLAIAAPHPIPTERVALLRNWIDDLPTLFSIDLINLNEASEDLLEQIERYGINI